VEKKYEKQLEGFSEEEYRKLEEYHDFFKVIDQLLPPGEDEDEDTPPPQPKRSRKRFVTLFSSEAATHSDFIGDPKALSVQRLKGMILLGRLHLERGVAQSKSYLTCH